RIFLVSPLYKGGLRGVTIRLKSQHITFQTTSKGASGQIRLMYLVNTTDCVIKLVWIYSHEQFAKRPTEVDLKERF
ncbi:MAG: hypothetical protein V7K15_04120, partial [Nostoc sp.]